MGKYNPRTGRKIDKRNRGYGLVLSVVEHLRGGQLKNTIPHAWDFASPFYNLSNIYAPQEEIDCSDLLPLIPDDWTGEKQACYISLDRMMGFIIAGQNWTFPREVDEALRYFNT